MFINIVLNRFYTYTFYYDARLPFKVLNCNPGLRENNTWRFVYAGL